MIKNLNQNDFVEMPWKNGKGKTLELFRIPKVDSFSFRISMAEVNADGPFSIFPNVDRILFLVSGEGMILKNYNSETETRLTEKWKGFHFCGEHEIHCTLIKGPCTDFNIMTDRGDAKTQAFTLSTSDHHFKCSVDNMFIYNFDSHTLTTLEKNDSFHFLSSKKKFLVVLELILKN